jgi:hypothetical protein
MNYFGNNNSFVDANSFRIPSRLVKPYSWVGHIPFLQWLLSESKGSNYVELGVHTGNSYFAACETISSLGSEAKAYAIDSWEGDHQAGYYNEEIFQTVNHYAAHQYPNTSVIIRKRFTDAAITFPDASIDLLHIDGLHTYEAVKEDYLTWLPKMSNKGIILFHDICVKENDFGVWRLWEEIKSLYPSFSFNHNFGLGVLVIGGGVGQGIHNLCICDEEVKNSTRLIYELLSHRVYRHIYDPDMLGTDIEKLSSDVRNLFQRVDLMEKSYSWRITAPLRKIQNYICGH